MKVLETQLVQRSFDGYWERIGRILDEENAYTYTSETGQKMTYVPERWVTLAVYPFIMEEVA